MEEIRNHPLWREARRLTLLAYRVTASFPRYESSQRLSAEIQGTCVTLLTRLMQTWEEPAPDRWTHHRDTQELAAKLQRLLREARKANALPRADYERLGRGVRSIHRSLRNLKSHA